MTIATISLTSDGGPSKRNNQLSDDNGNDNADNGNGSKDVSTAAAGGYDHRDGGGNDASNNDGHNGLKRVSKYKRKDEFGDLKVHSESTFCRLISQKRQ